MDKIEMYEKAIANAVKTFEQLACMLPLLNANNAAKECRRYATILNGTLVTGQTAAAPDLLADNERLRGALKSCVEGYTAALNALEDSGESLSDYEINLLDRCRAALAGEPGKE